jgi:hypothetical protein
MVQVVFVQSAQYPGRAEVWHTSNYNRNSLRKKLSSTKFQPWAPTFRLRWLANLALSSSDDSHMQHFHQAMTHTCSVFPPCSVAALDASLSCAWFACTQPLPVPHSNPLTSLHFIVTVDVQLLQSISTVDFDHCLRNTSDPGAVSSHSPIGLKVKGVN